MDKMREMMQKDWVLKVVSVCIAMLLWLYAEAEQNPVISKTFDIPVQVINLSDNYVVDNNIKTVRLVVRGKSTDLSGLRGDDFKAVADLRDAKIGTESYQIAVDVPTTVEKYSLTPNTLNLTIDEIIEKQLPIQPVISGTIPKGFLLERTEINPELITVRGKSTLVNQLEMLETESIDISALTDSAEFNVNVIVPAGVQVLGSNTVALKIFVQEELITREYSGTIVLENVPNGISASLENYEVNAIVRGSNQLVNDAEEIRKIKFVVDCSGIEAGEFERQVQYNGSLELVEVTPNIVTVTAKATVLQEQGTNDSEEFGNKHDEAEEEIE